MVYYLAPPRESRTGSLQHDFFEWSTMNPEDMYDLVVEATRQAIRDIA